MNTPQTREEGEMIAALRTELSLTVVPMKNGLFTCYGMMGSPIFPGTLDETMAYVRDVLEGRKDGPK